MFQNLSSNQAEKLFNILIELTGGNIGAATDAALKVKTSNGATEVTLTQVLNAIKAQIDVSNTLWTDNSGAYYVRLITINEGTGVTTITYTLPDGTSSTPGAGLRPLSTAEKEVTQEIYDVLIAGTGYSLGDILCKVAVIDALASTPTITTFWINLTTSATITAPSGANVQRANELIGVGPGENFMGAVGGKSTMVTPNIPTSSSPAYSIGDCIGGVITLTGASRLTSKETILQSLHIKDSLNQKSAFTILIFDSNPTGDTGFTATDNAAFAYGSGNAFSRQIGIIQVLGSDYITIDSKASAPLSGLGRVYKPSADANLYMVIVAQGTPTYGANSTSLITKLGFLQD